MKSVIEWGNYDDLFMGWIRGFMDSFVLFKEGANIKNMEDGLQRLVSDNLDNESGNFVTFFRNVNDRHFDNEVEWSSEGSETLPMCIFLDQSPFY